MNERTTISLSKDAKKALHAMKPPAVSWENYLIDLARDMEEEL